MNSYLNGSSNCALLYLLFEYLSLFVRIVRSICACAIRMHSFETLVQSLLHIHLPTSWILNFLMCLFWAVSCFTSAICCWLNVELSGCTNLKDCFCWRCQHIRSSLLIHKISLDMNSLICMHLWRYFWNLKYCWWEWNSNVHNLFEASRLN